MTSLYLYGICDRPELPLPAREGMEGVPLSAVSCAGTAAVLSAHSKAAIAPSETNLWQHEATVEALMADRTVLPARFGTMLSSEAVVESVLTQHGDSFAAALDHVRGRVEVGLRVLWRDDSDIPLAPVDRQPFSSGRSYMLTRLEIKRQRQARREQAEVLVSRIVACLSHLFVESADHLLPTSSLLLKAAYLVEKGQVAQFRTQVEQLGVAYPTLSFLCTGPWPPYSFVGTQVSPRLCL